MKEHQSGSAATGSGVMVTDDVLLIERVESSSFVAACDRLLVHLGISKITACLGDSRTSTQSCSDPVQRDIFTDRRS